MLWRSGVCRVGLLVSGIRLVGEVIIRVDLVYHGVVVDGVILWCWWMLVEVLGGQAAVLFGKGLEVVLIDSSEVLAQSVHDFGEWWNGGWKIFVDKLIRSTFRRSRWILCSGRGSDLLEDCKINCKPLLELKNSVTQLSRLTFKGIV